MTTPCKYCPVFTLDADAIPYDLIVEAMGQLTCILSSKHKAGKHKF